MKTKYLFLLLMLFLASACKNSDKQAPKEPVNDAQQEEKQAKKVVFPIPTPYSVANVLKESNAEFYEYLMNPLDHAKEYLTDEKQALNLGVYSTDLSYANVYSNTQLINEYFGVVKYLTDELGFTSLFTPDYMMRIQSNIDKPDSLFEIATETSYKTYEYLINRGKGDLATVVLAGSWIEALFLATQIANLTSHHEAIWQEIAQQKFTSETLVNQLEKFNRSSAVVANSLYYIKKIDVLMRRIRFKDDQAVYDKDLFNELSVTVSDIRSKIVKP